MGNEAPRKPQLKSPTELGLITLFGKMKTILLAFALCAMGLTLTGCVSAWMTSSTGKTLEISRGQSRDDVIRLLGEPKERRTDISSKARFNFSHIKEPIAFVEIFEYKGKINSPDEGSGQATVNAITLGIGEVFMIPMTAVDIAKRSMETNLIYVFFDSSAHVIGYLVKPFQENPPNQSSQHNASSGHAG